MLTTQPKKKRAANRKKHLQIKKTLFFFYIQIQ